MRWSLLVSSASALLILLTLTDSWVAKNARYLHPALVAAGHDVVFIGLLDQAQASLQSAPRLLAEDSPVSEAQDKDFAVLVAKHLSLRDVPDSPGLPKDQDDLEFAAAVAEHMALPAVGGGDFQHLSPAHQTYFSRMRVLKLAPRGAKGTVSRREAAQAAADSNVVATPAYGQDPLNKAFWYVSALPLEALLVGLDVILPNHLPGFKPDLVLVGPNEGTRLLPNVVAPAGRITHFDLSANVELLDAMCLVAQLRGLPVVSVSTADAEHVYYEDELLFNVEAKEYTQLFKNNAVGRSIQFWNGRIVQLVAQVGPHVEAGHRVNVNFPVLGGAQACPASGSNGPQFKHVVAQAPRSLGNVFTVPTLAVHDGLVVLDRKRHIKTLDSMAAVSEIALVELARIQHLLAPNQPTKITGEAAVLADCGIAVTVCDHNRGCGLGPQVLDVAALMELNL